MKQLTGKAKDDFFEWLKLTHYEIDYNAEGEIEGSVCWVGDLFDSLPQSAQFGLIQEWGDLLGFYIRASKSLDGYSYQVTRTLKHFQSFRQATLAEAQREAVKKLSEIYNN